MAVVIPTIFHLGRVDFVLLRLHERKPCSKAGTDLAQSCLPQPVNLFRTVQRIAIHACARRGLTPCLRDPFDLTSDASALVNSVPLVSSNVANIA